MKKFLTAIFAIFALLFTGIAAAPQANAAPAFEASVSVKAAKTVAPSVFNGGVKPTWYTVDGACYWGMDGGYYCYRYGCTNIEYWFYGCRTGWYRVNNYWYA